MGFAKIGAELIADIQGRWIPDGALGIWWLGQSSFVVKGSGTIVYIDPYLEPNPRHAVPPPLVPGQITHADVVLCSHDHPDHIDPVALAGIANASPRARIVVPAIAREKVARLGIDQDRVVAARVDRVTNLGALSLTAIPAAHEELDYSERWGYPYLGYLLELNGVVLYHAGDTTVYEGLLERLSSRPVDIALLPINGHDWKRLHGGTIGNMSYREAADLAVDAGMGMVIPMHYGMFPRNSEPPGHFVDYIHQFYPEQRIHVMARYEGFVYLKS